MGTNTTRLIGRRVRLLGTSDPYTRRQPGALGTVALIDSLGTLHVRWDDGGTLGLVPGEDDWELLDQTTRVLDEHYPDSQW